MSTFYINADVGVDSGAGGSGAPWLTLAYAITHSTTGDTIYCQNSVATYAFITQDLGTSRTLIGQSTAGVVFDGAAAQVQWSFSTSLTISYITFQNVFCSTGSSQIFYTPTTGTSLAFTSCVFRTITLYNDNVYSPYGGIISGSGSTTGNITLTNCLIDKPLSNTTDSSNNVYIFGGDGTPTITLINCTIYSNATGTSKIDFIFSRDDNTINIVLKNTVIQAVTSVDYNHQPMTNTATYSCLNGLTGTVPTGTGVITTDPLFVDAPNANFNLRSISPCVDSGSL